MSDFLFWDVDTQVDFMQPGGKLYVPGAENVIANVRRLNAAAAAAGIPLVSSVDAHQLTDPELQSYPPHCVAGTAGQKKVAGTVLDRSYAIPNRKVDLPGDLERRPQIVIEKQSVDVFTNPNIEGLLDQVARGKEIILYGVVTEICVDRAARGLIRRGYRVHLVRDAVRHLDENLAEATVAEIVRSGGKLLSTGEVLNAVHARAAV